MNKERIQELIQKYNSNVVDPSELKEIERAIESGELDITELRDLKILEDQLFRMEDPSPSLNLDDKFHQMLRNEIKSSKPGFSWSQFFSWPEILPKLAIASVALIIGIGVGLIVSRPAENGKEVAILTKEVSGLKEMMMLSMLEKESATDRLKAVSLTEDMDKVSSKVTNALLQTLNKDPNVNVRLAALEALHPYVNDNHVREELIHSITKQDSPLVQVALAELMAAIQEKSSVNALEKVLQNERTPKDVKKKIKESIQILT